MKKILITLWAVTLLGGAVLVPVATFAQRPGQSGYSLIQPCTGDRIIPGTEKDPEFQCTFSDFMKLVDRVITLLLYVGIVLSVISFVYAGYLLLFSGGSEDKLAQAKHIFTSVVIGLVLAYGAWIIVRFVVKALGVNEKEGYTLIDGIQ